MAGMPLRQLAQGVGFCQALNRFGQRCGSKMARKAKSSGRWLCRWHAGWSTGPRTAEGKARVALNLKQWRERVKTQG
jgi:hypothetical protein